MASKTGSTVVGELAMTRRMAPVARSRSSASVTSWNSRACPMAMAAWSAKLSRAAICPARERARLRAADDDHAEHPLLAHEGHR